MALIAPIAPPVASDPVSPINIFAGGALNHRKPNPAPTKAEQKILTSPIPLIKVRFKYSAKIAFPTR